MPARADSTPIARREEIRARSPTMPEYPVLGSCNAATPGIGQGQWGRAAADSKPPAVALVPQKGDATLCKWRFAPLFPGLPNDQTLEAPNAPARASPHRRHGSVYAVDLKAGARVTIEGADVPCICGTPATVNRRQQWFDAEQLKAVRSRVAKEPMLNTSPRTGRGSSSMARTGCSPIPQAR